MFQTEAVLEKIMKTLSNKHERDNGLHHVADFNLPWSAWLDNEGLEFIRSLPK